MFYASFRLACACPDRIKDRAKGTVLESEFADSTGTGLVMVEDLVVTLDEICIW